MLTAFLSSHAAEMSGEKVEVTPDSYLRNKDTHAVILVSVNSGRRWNFCRTENVQLRTSRSTSAGTEQGDDEAATFS